MDAGGGRRPGPSVGQPMIYQVRIAVEDGLGSLSRMMLKRGHAMEFDSSRHVAGQDSEISGPDGRRPYVAPFLRHLALTATKTAKQSSRTETRTHTNPRGPS